MITTEEQVKEVVALFKAGTKAQDIATKFGVKVHIVNGLISSLRKAGANIPKHVRLGSKFDYAKLAGEINATQ